MYGRKARWEGSLQDGTCSAKVRPGRRVRSPPETAGAAWLRHHLGAEADTLRVEGEEHIRTYRARLHDPARPVGRVPVGRVRGCEQRGVLTRDIMGKLLILRTKIFRR